MAKAKKPGSAVVPPSEALMPFPVGVIVGGDAAGIARCFAKLSKTFLEKSGRPSGTWPMIYDKTDQWVAWMEFFERIGHRLGIAWAKQAGCYLVPAEWPWEFSEEAASIENEMSKLAEDTFA